MALVAAAAFFGLAVSTAAGSAPFFPEDHWQASYPFGAPPDLHGVAALSDTTAFVVGDAGAVWLTTDAGTSWTASGPTTSVDLRAVAFPDVNDGWVAGADGAIFRTANAGLEWTVQNSGVTTRLNDLCFTDATNGWVVGEAGVILHTADGGATWAPQASTTASALNSVSMDASGLGWAVGDSGVILRTSDGGETWAETPSGTTEDLNGVTAMGDSRAWVVGNAGTFLFTYTDGDHWDLYEITEEARDLDLHAVTPYEPESYLGVVIVGEAGTWCFTFWETFTQMRVTPRILDVDVVPGGFWAVGRHGTVARTGMLPDGWQIVPIPTDAPAVNALSFLDDRTGWVVGDGGAIARTEDAGATWQEQQSGVAFDLHGVAFRDALHGWAVGAEATRLRTGDGGATWTPVGENGGGRPAYRDVAYAPQYAVPGEDRVWIVGEGREILRSTDGGDTWQDVYPAGLATYQYESVCAPLESVMFAAGPGAAGLWTADFGTTVNGNAVFSDARDVSFSDATHGWYVPASEGTKIMRTTDGGLTASEVLLYYGSSIPRPRAVDGVSSELAYAVGESSGLWRLQPMTYGIGSYRQTTGVPVGLNEVQAVDADHVWAVGDAGTVLHTTDGGSEDFMPPVTTVSPQLENRFYNTPVTLYFSATDDRSGVALTEYSVNGGPWVAGHAVTFAAPPDHSGDGTYYVHFRSTDIAGNVEAGGGTTVRIDTTPPSVSVTSDPPDLLGYWINTGILLTFAVSDAGQADRAEYKVNDGGWQTARYTAEFLAPLDHSEDGNYTITYRGVDSAGNVSAEQVTGFSLDTRRPAAKAPYPSTVRRYRYATLKFKIVDGQPSAKVGAVAFVITKLNGRIVKQLQPRKWYPTNTLLSYRFKCSLARGTYYFWVFAYDGAGNSDKSPARNKLVVK